MYVLDGIKVPCVEYLHDMNSIPLDSMFIGRYVLPKSCLDCYDTRYVLLLAIMEQNAETVFDGM